MSMFKGLKWNTQFNADKDHEHNYGDVVIPWWRVCGNPYSGQ